MEPVTNLVKRDLILERVSTCTTQLYNIKQISSATYAHKNRNGHFINTAKGYYGFQTFANFVKGHDEDTLANDINTFSKDFFVTVENCKSQLHDCFPALTFLYFHADKALGSPNSGLQALENTYQWHDGIVQAIQKLIGQILELKKDTTQWKNSTDPNSSYEMLKYLHESHTKKLAPEQVGVVKYTISYTTSFYYNFCRCLTGEWNWQDKIGDFHEGELYLGILPFRSPVYDSLEFMRQNNITTVMSITEVFENNSGTFQIPIKPIEYQSNNIVHFQMPAHDFKTLPMGDLEAAIDYLANNLKNKGKVYVHCKAGRGRSAEVVIAYLIKYHLMSVKEALGLVKSQRVQVSLSNERLETLNKLELKYVKKRSSLSGDFEFI